MPSSHVYPHILSTPWKAFNVASHMTQNPQPCYPWVSKLKIRRPPPYDAPKTPESCSTTFHRLTCL
ncbi:hypothetical protein BS50DRAFT_576116 [Corynespora cassiicola Philippines]|uniref:Uncharacterized protein n=1 Tax=Corynespora cassiicola Philippines TaxID=1448308 RepID=A0A2T2NH04_CORCC|nr:hypothetical protein BS50DRAFT_576116 [Corynespora cassiicola Philippines]